MLLIHILIAHAKNELDARILVMSDNKIIKITTTADCCTKK